MTPLVLHENSLVEIMTSSVFVDLNCDDVSMYEHVLHVFPQQCVPMLIRDGLDVIVVPHFIWHIYVKSLTAIATLLCELIKKSNNTKYI